jgi:hypothetical protein
MLLRTSLHHLSAFLYSLARWCVARWTLILYWLMFVGLSVLMVAPIWQIRYLPFGDLPDHAGQIRAMMEFDNYREVYRINWLTPYILSYLITMAFAKFMPVVIAIKVVLTLCLLAFPLAIAKMIRHLRGDRFWVISAFSIAYGYSFFWGFYGCFVGTAIAMYFLAHAVDYAKRPLKISSFARAAAFSFLAFAAHPIPWSFAVCAAVLIVFMFDDLRTTIKKSMAFFSILPIVVFWLAKANRVNKYSPGLQVARGYIEAKIFDIGRAFIASFHEIIDKHLLSQRWDEMFCQAIGRSAAPNFFWLCIFLLIWPVFFNGRVRFVHRRWLPLGLVILLCLWMPYAMIDTFNVNNRYAVFLVPMFLLVFDRSPPGARAKWRLVKTPARLGAVLGAFGCAVYMLADNARILQSFKKNDDDFRAILENMAPDKLVLTLDFDDRSELPIGSAYLHFGSWYQAEKRGAALYNFSHDMMTTNVPLRYVGRHRPIPVPWNPHEFNWQKHRGWNFHYFLVRSEGPRDYLFKDSQGKCTLLLQKGSWFLYGRTSGSR